VLGLIDFWQYVLAYWHVFHSETVIIERKEYVHKNDTSKSNATTRRLILWKDATERILRDNRSVSFMGYNPHELEFWFNPASLRDIFPKSSFNLSANVSKERTALRSIFYSKKPLHNMTIRAYRLPTFKRWREQEELDIAKVLSLEERIALRKHSGMARDISVLPFRGHVCVEQAKHDNSIRISLKSLEYVDKIAQAEYVHREDKRWKRTDRQVFGMSSAGVKECPKVTPLSWLTDVPGVLSGVDTTQSNISEHSLFFPLFVKDLCTYFDWEIVSDLTIECSSLESSTVLWVKGRIAAELETFPIIFFPVLISEGDSFNSMLSELMYGLDLRRGNEPPFAVLFTFSDKDMAEHVADLIHRRSFSFKKTEFLLMYGDRIVEYLSHFPWLWSRFFRARAAYHVMKGFDWEHLQEVYDNEPGFGFFPIDLVENMALDGIGGDGVDCLVVEGPAGSGKTYAACQLVRRFSEGRIIHWFLSSFSENEVNLCEAILSSVEGDCLFVFDSVTTQNKELFLRSLPRLYRVVTAGGASVRVVVTVRSEERVKDRSIFNDVIEACRVNFNVGSVDLSLGLPTVNQGLSDFLYERFSMDLSYGGDHSLFYSLDSVPRSFAQYYSLSQELASRGESVTKDSLLPFKEYLFQQHAFLRQYRPSDEIVLQVIAILVFAQGDVYIDSVVDFLDRLSSRGSVERISRVSFNESIVLLVLSKWINRSENILKLQHVKQEALLSSFAFDRQYMMVLLDILDIILFERDVELNEGWRSNCLFRLCRFLLSKGFLTDFHKYCLEACAQFADNYRLFALMLSYYIKVGTSWNELKGWEELMLPILPLEEQVMWLDVHYRRDCLEDFLRVFGDSHNGWFSGAFRDNSYYLSIDVVDAEDVFRRFAEHAVDGVVRDYSYPFYLDIATLLSIMISSYRGDRGFDFRD